MAEPFLRLSEAVDRMRGAPDPGGPDFRTRAGTLAVAVYGRETVFALPSLVNCAGLALSFGKRFVVHELSGGAIGAVESTDLHSLPGEPPGLLRGAWLVESRKLEEPLFGQTVCLGGYPFEGAVFLVGFGYPDGAYVARWRPAWGDRELAIPEQPSPLIEDVEGHAEWAMDAARFAVVLALLLEAEGTPVRLDTEADRARKAGRRARRGSPRAETIRYVTLGRPRARSAGEAYGAGGKLPAGYVPQQAHVAGHLKRQPVGPGARERKWIYVTGYEARRWVAPKARIRVRRGDR